MYKQRLAFETSRAEALQDEHAAAAAKLAELIEVLEYFGFPGGGSRQNRDPDYCRARRKPRTGVDSHRKAP